MASARKLEGVDGLRGVAVLLVIFFHHRLMHEGDPAHSTLYRLLAPFRFDRPHGHPALADGLHHAQPDAVLLNPDPGAIVLAAKLHPSFRRVG